MIVPILDLAKKTERIVGIRKIYSNRESKKSGS